MSGARDRNVEAATESVAPYSGFAAIYDCVMAGVDYEAWADYITKLIQHWGGNPRLLIDLACGTGSSTLPFARRGYAIEGMDLSEAMLRQARIKAKQEALPVRFFQGDLRSFKTDKQYDLALLFQDGLNYLLTESELAAALKCIYRCLNPGGMFIFDLTRPSLRGGEAKGTVYWADDENLTLIWQSFYRPGEGIWEVTLTAFYREEGHQYYRKFQEKHCERDFEPGLVKRLLEAAGFAVKGCYATFSLEPSDGDRPKLTFVAEKK